METIKFELQPYGDHMRYAAIEGDKEIGEITFLLVDKGVVVIDHTFVEGKYNGKGIAFDLVKHVIDLAKEKNLKIIPLCPYARKVFDTHDEFSDIEYKRILR